MTMRVQKNNFNGLWDVKDANGKVFGTFATEEAAWRWMVQHDRVDEVIRKVDLPRYCGLQRSQVDVYIALNQFPKPIKIGDRAVAWMASEVRQWQLDKIAERDTVASNQEQVMVVRRRLTESDDAVD